MMKRAFLLCALLLMALPISAQDETPPTDRTLSVTGTGSASGSPDIAFINVGVEIQNADVATAVNEVNQTVDDVISALNELGIPEENIRTTNFNIRQQQNTPAPNSTQGENADVYVVSNTAQVRVSDISQISTVIQTALDAGANRMYGLRFDIQDPEAIISEARQNAVDNARMRAQELAQMFGVTLGEPLTIDEVGTGGNQPIPAERAAIGGGNSISEGQLSVNVQLNVVYTITSP